MVNQYFITDSNTIQIYVTCRKDESLTSNDIWAQKYRKDQLSQQSIKLPTNDTIVDYRDWTILDFMQYAESVSDDNWTLEILTLTNEEIQNGIGEINLKTLFANFFAEKGDGDYLIQIFFADDNAEKVFSLPSDISKVTITDTTPVTSPPVPTSTPSP
jgi:hypothetical protein